MNHGYEASLVKRVVNQLVAGIINGDYADHVLPPQVILSKTHGVSRAIMREAISILVSRRMLDVRTKTGTRITPSRDWLIIDHEVADWRLRATPDPEYLHGLIAFRKLVDPRAAAFAAARASRHQRIAITAMYQNLQRTRGDQVAQEAAEDALQAAIIEASGDPLLRQMGSIVRMGLRAMQAAPRMQRYSHDAWLADYGKVVRAIEGGDAERAESAMMRLVTHSADLLRGEAV
ncbi:MAG TPA: FCD domain-containing protein [Paraburkholderia sp.]|uniref:FadR/GntR family transcriptional regulator n=1 Tax=Paraburkholderia sp. TaxID=1926495 RepID=UPI002ED4379F